MITRRIISLTGLALLFFPAPGISDDNERVVKLNLAEMVLIPAGSFIMGAADVENESPPHKVFVSNFYIGRYEITNQQYLAFWESKRGGDGRFHTPKSFPETGLWPQVCKDKPEYPVVGVSWWNAMAFCEWSNRMDGITDPDRAYRLPTEAEWEKAARGPRQQLYPWGNTWEYGKCNHGIMVPRQGVIPFAGDGVLFTAPVYAYEARCGKYNLYNMAGNVAEWCLDRFGTEYYRLRADYNPKGPTIGRYRVVRGGSYLTNELNMRVTTRLGYYPDNKLPYIGFRLARGVGY